MPSTAEFNQSQSDQNQSDSNQSYQSIVFSFSEQQVAEDALQALQTAGFTQEQLQLNSQTPPVPQTEAKKSGGKGAIVGALAGGLIGLIFGYAKVNLAETANVGLLGDSLGMVLAGSLVGAAAMSIIAAMSGVNVIRDQVGTETSALTPIFLVSVNASQPEEIAKAQSILEQYTTA
ncbi:MAG: hypothetical protein HY785_04810 [Oscillatoriophycideae cyanobacterium NC_groundwater_1537_Pr4_S-0.65um_50_18]|nr:hypothetical protein [Oscillatoriophycideae cyanobacterium NC_groundwater_1537_Pr4_S-0.65um_50_18]